MQKILLVFGTRPEAIKMAPLVRLLKKHSDEIQTSVCVTGQHKEMLNQVLNVFNITPDFDLSIMKSSQDLYDITAHVLTGMREVLKDVKPNMVLVHGDTTTSMAAALAAFYQQIPVGHVEAGLRTNNMYSPWPEEMNRQISGRIASLHFAPTQLSKKNLLNEGVNDSQIIVTGNTIVDALIMVVTEIKNNHEISGRIIDNLHKEGINRQLISSWKKNRKLILITGHRRENFGNGFLNICNAIKELSVKYPEVDFVYPVHLNPNVKEPVYKILSASNIKNIFLTKPLEYLSFVCLMHKSYLILTDSGGIQEEAPSLGKPVLVMRDTTERPEAVEAGTVVLVGTDKEKIIEETSRLLEDEEHYEMMAKANNPYGDGKASERIVNTLLKIFSKN